MTKTFPDVVWKPGVLKVPWFMRGVECFVKLNKVTTDISQSPRGSSQADPYGMGNFVQQNFINSE